MFLRVTNAPDPFESDIVETVNMHLKHQFEEKLDKSVFIKWYSQIQDDVGVF